MQNRRPQRPDRQHLTHALLAILLAATWGAGCVRETTEREHFTPSVAAGDVLIVLTAASVQTLEDGSTRETGYFLNEFYAPLEALEAKGYRVTIATPDARPPALDPESLDPKYWEDDPEALAQARALVASHPQLKSPRAIEDIIGNARDFQGILIPGGQGVMEDLLDDPMTHALLEEFGRASKPVGLICHAPALLTRASFDPNPFHGRSVTSVSRLEELYIERLVMSSRARVRMIGSALDAAGYDHDAALPGRAHAVRDCNLVTSQNPFSGEPFNALFLAALDDWRGGMRCDATSGQ